MSLVDTDLLTDAGTVLDLIPNEDVYSVSQPDPNGKVRAVVNLGGRLVLIEGRRIFNPTDSKEAST